MPPADNTTSNPDFLSLLPDELLIKILSGLPSTKLCVRTSLLSRRYRLLWRSSSSLDFPLDDFPDPSSYTSTVDRCLLLSRRYRLLWRSSSSLDFPLDDFPDPSSYTSTVDRCLLLSDAPTLTRFRVHASPLPSPSPADFDRWIRFAAARSVSSLALSFFSFLPHRPDLPPSFSLVAPHLSSLKLIRCRFPSTPLSFPSITTLYLSTITISDDTAAVLLASCPLLETLYLCNCTGLTRLEVSSAVNPRLVNLNLERVTRKSVDELVVKAPNLRLFDFEGNVRKLHLGLAPNLHAAQILSRYWLVLEEQNDWAELVAAVANVEILAVSCWFFEFALDEDSGLLDDHQPLFKNLRELHWNGVSITEDNLLALVLCLGECPMLQKLCINLDYTEELNKAVAEQNPEEEVVPMDHAQSSTENLPPESDPDDMLLQHFESNMVLLSQLKVFSITQFSVNRYAMQMLEFILGRAENLELLRLSLMPEPEVEFELLHEKLSCFPHASQHLKIEILKIEGDSVPQDHKLFQHLWSF